jgi:hypothetical protein
MWFKNALWLGRRTDARVPKRRNVIAVTVRPSSRWQKSGIRGKDAS